MKTVKEFLKDKRNDERWLKILASLDITETEELLEKIKEMQDFILSQPLSIESGSCDHIIMPIIIRAYKKYDYLIRNCRAVYQFVSKNYILFKSFSTGMAQYPGIDLEAQFVELQASEIARLKL